MIVRMKRLSATFLLGLVLIATLTACHKSTTTVKTDDQTVAAKAGDAALRARKKAEAIKADEDKKAKETNSAMDQ
jgi:hypothetical protein